MKEIALESWSDFRAYIDQATSESENLKTGLGSVSQLLYRGHADSSWNLETTLERHGHQNMDIERYYRLSNSAHRYISNFSTRKYAINENPVIDYDSLRNAVPNYEFLAFLRHHGLPSPLLDWTQSPYVAAFFAFHRQTQEKALKVAIFLYQEYRGSSKSYCSSEGSIRSQGPWASIHERHILQQSWYTICLKCVPPADRPIFCPHDEAFISTSQQRKNQDYLVKLTLPATERIRALKELFQMNITPYSLFHSEDALMSTVAIKLFDKI